MNTPKKSNVGSSRSDDQAIAQDFDNRASAGYRGNAWRNHHLPVGAAVLDTGTALLIPGGDVHSFAHIQVDVWVS
jgi:hypothetical protein